MSAPALYTAACRVLGIAPSEEVIRELQNPTVIPENLQSSRNAGGFGRVASPVSLSLAYLGVKRIERHLEAVCDAIVRSGMPVAVLHCEGNDIGPMSSSTLSNFISRPGSALTSLLLARNNLGDSGTVLLSTALLQCGTTQTAGHRSPFPSLAPLHALPVQSPSVLSHLSLTDNGLGDQVCSGCVLYIGV
ncbi:hypothetical protein KIPB_010979 [Kipferlia bialata]|uniref:Uncharacterized protein n=1 Tax=Kipferlia bialata TaxID=797122 RepID=A0A9K3D435_9EUKA|nr:hypothetical protein KIPB_010979 [Kipferlia bialata]|eukprot:g10979.t1